MSQAMTTCCSDTTHYRLERVVFKVFEAMSFHLRTWSAELLMDKIRSSTRISQQHGIPLPLSLSTYCMGVGFVQATLFGGMGGKCSLRFLRGSHVMPVMKVHLMASQMIKRHLFK